MEALFTEDSKNSYIIYNNNRRILNKNCGDNKIYHFYYKDSLGRVKMISHFRLISITKSQSILDFGCGKGFILDDKIKGYDPYVEKYKVFPHGKYDLIMSTMTLHHIEDIFFKETLNLIKKSCSNHFVSCLRLKSRNPRTIEWYLEQFEDFFIVESYYYNDNIDYLTLWARPKNS
jgi:2-polyprenyl-3-methyl-5-hydroxy-6-metoxy-1,4-benzoquinol methylase